MLYLASPYSHPDPKIKELRYKQACEASAYLLCKGHFVISPIVHGHPLVQYNVPGDWGFWQEYGTHLLEIAEAMMVLTLDGWKESIGVQAEIKIAEKLKKQISYLSYSEIKV